MSGDAEWDLVYDQNNGLTGLVADYGTNTPVGAAAGTAQGQESQQLTALGIPECGSSQQPMLPTATSPIKAVYFSPNNTQNGTDNGLSDIYFNDPQLEEVPVNDWAANCTDSLVGQYVPTTADTLVGWSRGRLGPIYFLEANRDRWSQIHTIILFDPGGSTDFTSQDSCDRNYNVNGLLADWLASSPNNQNQLIVFTGAISEQNGFHGLWSSYFADIWQRAQNDPAFHQQTIVCDYSGMEHHDLIRNFAGYISDFELEPMNVCPQAPDDTNPTQWNP